MTNSHLDPSRCPLCRQQNECGMVNGAGTCWCFTSRISPDAVERAPGEAATIACLCQDCLSGLRQQTDQLERIRESIRRWR
ncbi:MAG: cysteine-rich CWC family protein [Nitrospirota bacterium]